VDPKIAAKIVEHRRPKVLALTHVPTNSGLVQPVAEIGEICRETGTLFLLDACQSVGQIEMGVEALGCDFLSATSRKFLRGPRGAGFLYVSDRVLEAGLEPLFIDMRGARWLAPDEYLPAGCAKRFETWEFAWSLVLGTGAAVAYAMDVGIPEIAERTGALASRTRSRLSEEGLRVLDRGVQQCGIVTVEIPREDPFAFHDELERRGVNSAVSLREFAVIDYDNKGVTWALRISPHYYNTEDEIDMAVEHIVDLSGTR
jgi:selenocysteine lyase/cysteine desulfurase